MALRDAGQKTQCCLSNPAPSCDNKPMATHFIITEYIARAMADAEYDKLDDGSFSGRLPACTGVIAFGATLAVCETELHSTLEDWLLVGFKLGHRLPVIAGIDLNKDPQHEPMASV